jgi:hypothetical protein
MLRCSDGRIRYFGTNVSYAGAAFRIAAWSEPRTSAAARRAISAATTHAAAKPVGIETTGNARMRPQAAAIPGSSKGRKPSRSPHPHDEGERDREYREIVDVESASSAAAARAAALIS